MLLPRREIAVTLSNLCKDAGKVFRAFVSGPFESMSRLGCIVDAPQFQSCRLARLSGLLSEWMQPQCSTISKPITLNRSRTVMQNPFRILLTAIFVLVPAVNFGLPPLLAEGNQFADDPPTRVAAAGYAFAIWGVIFAGMLLFSFYLLSGKETDSQHLKRATVLLAIAGLASIAFVPISIYCSSLVGWLDILAHLVPLLLAHFELRKHAKLHPQSNIGRWTYFGPSMYFGWISAATVISTALMASEVGIVVDDSLATTIAIATAVILAGFAIWMTINRDPVYGATIAWALVAIGVKQSGYLSIQYAVWAAAAFITASVIYRLTRRPNFFPLAHKSDYAPSID